MGIQDRDYFWKDHDRRMKRGSPKRPFIVMPRWRRASNSPRSPMWLYSVIWAVLIGIGFVIAKHIRP